VKGALKTARPCAGLKTATVKTAALALAGAVAVGLTGCGASAPGTAPEAGTSATSGTVRVFAAASLKTTFTRLASEFEAQNPGVKVTLSFAGSSDLATQIAQGAPADVFASADTRNMALLQDQGLLDGAPQDFATNVLAIAVPAGNPASIHSFADLAKPGAKVVICASQVPCGAAAAAVEKATGTSLSPVSEESSVTDVLGKVVSGEADAGLVYRTDVRTAGGKVEGIPFPEADQAVNTYPIAAVAGSKSDGSKAEDSKATGRTKGLAAAFIALVTGSKGKQALSDAGFGLPQE
jgi:molybdate transport system substrate-binding protein